MHDHINIIQGIKVSFVPYISFIKTEVFVVRKIAYVFFFFSARIKGIEIIEACNYIAVIFQ